MAAKIILEMSVDNYNKLADFLEGHEYEIATKVDAYDELSELFELVLDQKPSEDS